MVSPRENSCMHVHGLFTVDTHIVKKERYRIGTVSNEKFLPGAVRGLQLEDRRNVLGFVRRHVRTRVPLFRYKFRQKKPNPNVAVHVNHCLRRPLFSRNLHWLSLSQNQPAPVAQSTHQLSQATIVGYNKKKPSRPMTVLWRYCCDAKLIKLSPMCLISNYRYLADSGNLQGAIHSHRSAAIS
jgi:hypothetical protein